MQGGFAACGSRGKATHKATNTGRFSGSFFLFLLPFHRIENYPQAFFCSLGCELPTPTPLTR